jgi:hypothetical protein
MRATSGSGASARCGSLARGTWAVRAVWAVWAVWAVVDAVPDGPTGALLT